MNDAPTPQAPPPSVRRSDDARRRLLIVDALSIAGGICIAIALHRVLGIADAQSPRADAATIATFAVFGIVTLLRLALAGEYDTGRRFQRVEDAVRVTQATFVGASVAIATAVVTKGFFLDFESYSRAYLALGIGAPTLLLFIHRIAGYHIQLQQFRAGRALVRQLVIGNPEDVATFRSWVARRPDLGIDARASDVDLTQPLDRLMAHVVAELEAIDPDDVVLAMRQPPADLRAALVREATFGGRSVTVLPAVFEDYYDLPFARRRGVPVARIFESDSRRVSRTIKYGIDRIGAILGLVALLPLFALIAIAIWLEDRGPVIFVQVRVGERGRHFGLRKFRTMRIDAEARLAELQAMNEASGPIFKMREDPRVTRVGRFLRRTSLDELPQLWNVAFGDMSMVGPRPPLPSEVDEYSPTHARRLLARPGMTGLWQVSGRSATSFDEMVRLDLVYIEDWSFALDVQILLRTVRVVFGRRGAY